MKLSAETKRELLADCTPEELQAAIDAKEPKTFDQLIQIHDLHDCTTSVDVRGPKNTFGDTDWVRLNLPMSWSWDVTSIEHLIAGLQKLASEMTR